MLVSFCVTVLSGNADGSYKWPVGLTLETPPIIQLKDADGANLRGYQVSTRAVHPDTLEPLGEAAIFDLIDGKSAGLDRILNPTGIARGTPAVCRERFL